MPVRRIFISATNLDLRSHRRLASEAMRRRGYDAVDEAIFRLTHGTIAAALEERIASCDAVVCLIGFVFGGEPSERPPEAPRRSHTQWEFDTARRLNKDVYLLLADESTPFDPHDPEPDDLRDLQRLYRAEAIRDRDYRPFSSVDSLRVHLAELRFPWEGPPPDQKPNNLPFASLGTLFKGRETFLDDLRDGLDSSRDGTAAIVARQAVHGLGGVGKTRTAIEYAWRHVADYSSLLFVTGPTSSRLRSSLADLCDLLGIAAGVAVDQRLTEVLHWLDDHPGWLLILDNLDTEDAAAEAERLLNRLRAGHVLITSRLSNWSASIKPLELHVLTESDAVSYLCERALKRRRAADDAASALTLARELDGLALALEQAAAYIDKLRLSFADYLARWREKQTDVLSWHDPRLMGYPASIAATWETTFDQLSAPERLLLGVVSWLAPEPISLALFDTAPLKEALTEPRDALAGLAGYSLVRFDDSAETVIVHRLVQAIGRRRAVGVENEASLPLALAAVNALAPLEADDIRTWPVWTPLAPHASALIRHAEASGVSTGLSTLMSQLGLYLHTLGQYREAEPLWCRALAIDEQELGPDHSEVAKRLNNLACLLRDTGRPDEAEPLFRRSLAIDERFFGPDHPVVANCLNNLAVLLRTTGRLDEAEPLFRRSLAIVEQALRPNDPMVANYLNNLAVLLRTTGRPDEAEPLLRRSLAIDEQIYGPDHPEVGTDLHNLAALLHSTGRSVEAEPLSRRAVTIFRRFRESTGHEHLHWPTVIANYRKILEAMALSQEEILRRMNEVGGV